MNTEFQRELLTKALCTASEQCFECAFKKIAERETVADLIQRLDDDNIKIKDIASYIVITSVLDVELSMFVDNLSDVRALFDITYETRDKVLAYMASAELHGLFAALKTASDMLSEENRASFFKMMLNKKEELKEFSGLPEGSDIDNMVDMLVND